MTWSRIGPLAITIAVLIGIGYYFRDEISAARITASLAGQDLYYLSLSVILFAVGIAGSAARYRYVIRRVIGANASLNYLVLLTNFSFACSYLAPMNVAAEVLRVGFTRHYLRVNISESIRLVLIDKLLGLVGVAMIALVLVPSKLAFGINRELVYAEVLGILGFFAVAFALGYAGSWLAAHTSLLNQYAYTIGADWRFIVGHFVSVRDVMSLLAYTLLSVGGFGLGMVVVARALGFDIGAPLLLLIAPTVLLAQNAPMFYAGFGAREATVLIAFKDIVSLDPNVVLGFSVMIGVMLLIASIVPSLLFVLSALRRTKLERADRQ